MSSETTISGWPVFAVVAVVIVPVSGLIGAVVGANGNQQGMVMHVLGVLSFPMTVPSMAAFGAGLAAGIMALLYGLIRVASRYDDHAIERGDRS